MEMSDEHNAIVIVAPRRRPYNLPEQLKEKMEFNIELARMADLAMEPISSPSGVVIGYTCGGQEFVHSLLRLHLSVHHLELVELLHPDEIKFHMSSGFDCMLVEETVHLFLVRFWKETDKVKIREGDLKGMKGMLGDIDWH